MNAASPCFAGALLRNAFRSQARLPARPSSSLEKISKEAEADRDANRIDEAIALYKKGISIKPSWEEGWWYLGTLYYDLDNYPQGRDAFKHLTLIKPDVAVGLGHAWAL